ncbi:MAG: hypothetical protein NDI61_05065 [Bdellovibrionaceae bacterium]|nr:hypothetical protein [Pseudobdellovibrionaceae bacterium]
MKRDEETVSTLGLTHESIGRFLALIRRLSSRKTGVGGVKYFTLDGVSYKLHAANMYTRQSPFADGSSSDLYVTVTKGATGESFEFHGLFPEMIARHGFYGDPGNVNRVDPKSLKEFFGDSLK